MRDTCQLAVISLGSNLGDSARLLRAAVERLAEFSVERPRCSSFWATTPVDCPPGSPPFVNAVALLVPPAGMAPEQLLAELQALEREFGRRRKVVLNEPRPLDLDLVWFGSETRSSPQLTLPHPRAHLRRFVLQPLAELLPEAVFPGQEKTVSELLERLQTDEQVSRLDETPD